MNKGSLSYGINFYTRQSHFTSNGHSIFSDSLSVSWYILIFGFDLRYPTINTTEHTSIKSWCSKDVVRDIICGGKYGIQLLLSSSFV